MERKGRFPGGKDEYRETLFKREYDDHTFRVIQSNVMGSEEIEIFEAPQ